MLYNTQDNSLPRTNSGADFLDDGENANGERYVYEQIFSKATVFMGRAPLALEGTGSEVHPSKCVIMRVERY